MEPSDWVFKKGKPCGASYFGFGVLLIWRGVGQERGNHRGTEVSEEGGRKCTGAAVPLWPVERWQDEPLQPLEINDGEESHLQLIEDPMPEHKTVPKKSVNVREAHTGVVHRWEDDSLWEAPTLVG